MRLTTALMSAALVGLSALTACASPAVVAPPQVQAEQDRVDVTVERDGDRWTADYRLDRDAPAWAFFRSALLRESRQPWRPSWWRVEIPGVVLERIGDYDVLRSTDGGPVPRRIRIVMTPRAGDLEAEYDPALMFSDGTVALFSGQFDVFPLESAAAARAFPRDLNGVDVPGGPALVTWRDRSGPVLFKGERRPEVTALDAQTYVLFGDATTRQGNGVTTVIDPGLPRWLGDELAGFTPRVMTYYADRLGRAPGEPPTLMVSWTGPTKSLSSMGGSVLPGLISMNFEGEGVLDPDVQALSRARWFIGHEAAHFWLGSQGLKYQYAREAWITEGGADLMAVRALKAIDPTYDDRAELQREVDDCVRLATGKPVSSAGERGEHRAYYACGAVWGLVIEAAERRARGGDFFDVVAEFQRRNNDDGVLSREEWLGELTRLSRDPTLANDIATLLDVGVTDPSAVIARLFQRTGVAFRQENGRIVLI
ncbi:hypothetical protein [Brevundimonas sp.]|jgi:hypothetical protein|uniref:hypothetical protein n=1 Tax=Brevundimonas sp. TaxID=1871086 RepID=UPI0017E0F311|nr:hypothetical protein [Brevundimonas sp.]MBA4806733.1 hypothetical protein [Brevundimonas sp.]